MANSSDGSVVIDVNMNTGPADKKLVKLKENIEKTEEQISDITKKRDEAKEKSVYDAAELDAEKAKLHAIKEEIAEIKAISKDKTVSPSIRAEALADLPTRQSEYNEQKTRVSMLQNAWNQTERSVDRYNQQLSDAQQRLEQQKTEAGGLEREIAAAASQARELATSAQISDQGIVDLRRELEQLTARQAELRSAGLGLGTEEYDQIAARMAEINRQLKEYERGLSQASESAEEAAESTEKISEAAKRANSHMSNFGSRFKSIVAGALVFNVISTGMRKFTDWVGKAILVNEDARASIASLKGALLTLAQPIVEVVIPAFTMLLNIITRVINVLAQLVSSIFGKTISQSREGAKALYKETKALEGVGGAADSAAGSLAGFDEINTISTENAGGGGGSAGGFGDIAPDFTGMIEDQLTKIQALLGWALLAVGAILTFSGANIPLGIALMAAGAYMLASAITTDWDKIVELLQGPMGVILGILSVAFLVIGAILTFSGTNIPLGIALMVIGAATLAAVVAVNWDTIQTALQGPIGTIVAIISGALLVLGAILAFSGANIPLGIGLMIVGAAGLAAVAAANWDSLSEVLRGPVGVILALVSGALLVIGALLAFSGANVPLGLGLMAAGAIGLAVTIAANWQTIKNALEGPVGAVTAIISTALLAVGAILAFSGANVPLGIGMMVVGAVGLATSIAANWETIQNALKGPIGAIVAVMSTAFLVLGASLLFSGANIPLGLGLLVVGATGLAASLSANWETIQNALKGPVGAIVALISTAFLVLGGVLLFSGASIPIGLGLLVIGAVGLAASISANWDNIRQTLGGTIQTITALVSAALLVLGVVLLFSGAGIPLGLGLIGVGAAGLAAVIAPNWDSILEKLKGVWSGIKGWWNDHVAKFFTADFWKNLGSDILNGFLCGLKKIWDKVVSWAEDAVSWFKGLFSDASDSVSYVKSGVSDSRFGTVGKQSTYSASSYSLDLSNVPALAQGAVIPPNREFLARLGDQSNGNNLEAPESLIRRIVREESGGGNTALLEAILEAIKDGHIIMVDRQVLGRTVTREQNRMTRAGGRSVLLG